ncbi:MAG: thioredoxin family protein [Notoacmeibacter sp.]|nr:thioredoxin family protein [Notoacmeibacter sp.]
MQRRPLLLILSAIAGALLSFPAMALDLLPEPRLGDDGLHHPDWFLQSFLDIGDDFTEAKAAGKGLVIVVEQAGCPYCREMHRVNLRDPEIVDIIRANFNVVQLDLRGSREVVDTDGTAMAERDLIRKWGMLFTPTLIFLAKDGDPAGKPAAQAAAAIMPGYFKPYHFVSMFDYVASGAYHDRFFQDFIIERRQRLEAEGKDVSIWD